MRNMKNDFSVSLMKMLDKKSLEDITVTDIVNDCKVSRQTFYYHFNDIYTIVGWIYAQETQKALNDHLDINTWMTGCCNLLHWMEENRVLIINTHKSINREYTESFMNNVLFDYIYQMVDEQPDALLVSKNSKEFIAKYYTLAFNAVALDWIHTGMKEIPENITQKIEILFSGSLKNALNNM